MSRFVTKTMHSYIDYPVAIGLMVMPFILSLGEANEWAILLSAITGVAALLLTAITDHKTGIFKILPYKIHLTVDFMVGIVFVLAPFALGFTALDFWYYLVVGLTVLAVVGLHKPEPVAQVATA